LVQEGAAGPDHSIIQGTCGGQVVWHSRPWLCGADADHRTLSRGRPRVGGWRLSLARYQQLNPLDYMFFVGNEVRRRLGLPGVDIQLLLEMKGSLDLEGFKRALRGLYRIYPATGGRLERSAVSGQPRWRLDVEPEWRRAVRVERLSPGTPGQLHVQSERLLRSGLDLERGPLLQFHLFRGMGSGDVLAMRWPHALMDARGGMIVLEELQRLYEEKPALESLKSVGDELRDDVGELIAGLSPVKRTRALFEGARGGTPPGCKDVRLAVGPAVNDARGLHYLLRRLSVEQTQRVQDASLRVCGFARMGDYVRACALRALHRTIARRLPKNAGYSTMQLVDNRKRRQQAPVCRNFFSALPVYVPAAIVDDRRATADVISTSTAQALSAGLVASRYAALERMSRVPVSVLAELMLRAQRADPGSVLARGLGKAPSLPMGFMGTLSRPLPTFCGAEWVDGYGSGVILPHEGFGLNLAWSNDLKRLNVTATYFEPRVTKQAMSAFLDHFFEALLDANSAGA
jgi:hypothetical protein